MVVVRSNRTEETESLGPKIDFEAQPACRDAACKNANPGSGSGVLTSEVIEGELMFCVLRHTTICTLLYMIARSCDLSFDVRCRCHIALPHSIVVHLEPSFTRTYPTTPAALRPPRVSKCSLRAADASYSLHGSLTKHDITCAYTHTAAQLTQQSPWRRHRILPGCASRPWAVSKTRKL